MDTPACDDMSDTELEEGGPATQPPEQLDHVEEDPTVSLFIDARNGFNELGRKAAMWTVRHRWAAASRFAFNCYRHAPQLMLCQLGKLCIILLSQEGVTQGDPLSMILYGLALSPLAEKLKRAIPDLTQPWYADDAAMVGRVTLVAAAMTLLMEMGPARGYFPEPAKSIVVSPEAKRTAIKSHLEQFDFQYENGSRYVGGYIGPESAHNEWLSPQVQKWATAVKSLAKVARRYPQTAYAGLAQSLQSEWTYLQRVSECAPAAFAPVEKALVEDFLPALLGESVDAVRELRPLLALPVRSGGLGISNPTTTTIANFQASVASSKPLVATLRGDGELDIKLYRQWVTASRLEALGKKEVANSTALAGILSKASNQAKRRIRRACESGQWLSVKPSRLNGTALSAEEFRDNVRLRFGLLPQQLPEKCDGCDQRFGVGHALSCKKGGLVLLRHNEVAGEWHRMCAQALTQSAVSNEPIIPTSQDRTQGEATGNTSIQPANRGDIAVRGFWKRSTTAIFDVRITDTDAPSYRGTDPGKVLSKQEKEKKDKHLTACLAARRQFTPLVFSVDGMRGAETDAACKRLAALLAGKWERPYSELCGYVRSRLSIALVRATTLCLRGSRDPTARSPAYYAECGAGLSLY
jgi:hypothetical protein